MESENRSRDYGFVEALFWLTCFRLFVMVFGGDLGCLLTVILFLVLHFLQVN